MTTLESVFLDEYKRLNAVCSDMFHDKNGVTAYLNYMDTVPNAARQGISTWSYDRSTLLRLRHVRNQIAHSTESSSCTEEDLNKLKTSMTAYCMGRMRFRNTRSYARQGGRGNQNRRNNKGQ